VAANPNSIDADRKWLLLMKRRFELKIATAFDHFRNTGIEPLLLKGWVTSRAYPELEPRAYTDIDLAVSSIDYETAQKLLELPEIRTLSIDLHKEVRHLDTLPWAELFARSEIVGIGGTDVRIPCPEDHLRIVCVHWLNDGGASKERLRDIYYAVANRPKEFDWERCLGCVSETRRKWVITAIGLAHRYLDLYIDDLPFANEARHIPAWVERTLKKEWQSDTQLLPLHTSMRRPRVLIQQIKKRIPPNPIQATIAMEAPIDDSWRLPYQLGNTVQRLFPSIRRITRVIFPRRS
jgi:hypothetical protein